MKWIYVIPMLLLITLYQNCSVQQMESSHELSSTLQNGAGQEVLSASSLEAFETTVFPIVSNNCGRCHGGSQAPQFAVNDPGASLEALIQYGLISELDPAGSRIVQKVRQGHQGFASTLADELQQAITQWALKLEELRQSGAVIEPPPAPPVLEATFSSIHKLILVPKCVGCHSPGGVRSKEDYSNYQTTISTGKVTKGLANDSAMYTECKSGEMPDKAPNLSSEELAVMRDWINNGALNN